MSFFVFFQNKTYSREYAISDAVSVLNLPVKIQGFASHCSCSPWGDS